MKRFHVILYLLAASPIYAYEAAPPSGRFWVPRDPPSAQYVLHAKVTVSSQTAIVASTGELSFTNVSRRPLQVLAFDWARQPDHPLEIIESRQPLRTLDDGEHSFEPTLTFFELHKPLAPGKNIRLFLRFASKSRVRDGKIDFGDWYPRLWWDGLRVRNRFKVKLDLPPRWIAAASGRLNAKTGWYENDFAATRFGLFLANGMKEKRRETGGVEVTALFTERGRAAARLELDTAVDAIAFYRKWLGVFPRKFLYIIPGGPKPWGGFPYASGIVVIHGEETFDPVKGEKKINWWKWITAYEVGHQYWGEFVLPENVGSDYTDSWLMIGLGICADKKYMLARGLGWEEHRELIDRYLKGVRAHDDTTMDAPPSLAQRQTFDVNNVIHHGKSFAALSALETYLGQNRFDKIYRRAILEYGGKRLGWRAFQKLCESESGENLNWFFDDWVRSNKPLNYWVESQSTKPGADGFISEVRVAHGLTSIQMPIPVQAVFEDGSRQIQWTRRFAKSDVLRFQSRSKLKSVQIDPQHRLAVVSEQMPPTPEDLTELTEKLNWEGGAGTALKLFQQPGWTQVKSPYALHKMGVLLFGGNHWTEAFSVFNKLKEQDPSEGAQFIALSWMGVLKDLMGERNQALDYYEKALKFASDRSQHYDQYNLAMDRRWLEQRLHSPFGASLEPAARTPKK